MAMANAFDDDQQNSAEQVQLRAYWLSFIKTAGIDKEYSVFYASIFLVRFLGTTATTTRCSHLATDAPTNHALTHDAHCTRVCRRTSWTALC